MPKPAMREYDPIAEVANKLYSRTEIRVKAQSLNLRKLYIVEPQTSLSAILAEFGPQ